MTSLDPKARRLDLGALGTLLIACWLAVSCGGPPPLPPAAARLNDAAAEALARGQLDAAARQLELALEYQPTFVEALTNLGLVELRRGNLVRARQLLQRAQRIDENVAQPHNGLGLLAETLGRRADAGEHYRDALAVDPGFPDARANLARLYYEDGRYNHALEEFEKLQHGAPDRAEGYVGTAESLLALGRVRDAAVVLERARSHFGELPGLRIAEGRRLLLDNQLQAAAQQLLPLAGRTDRFGVQALAWLSVVELARGAPEQAVGAARLALAHDPEHALATYALANALVQLEANDAEVWLNRAQELNPGLPQPNYNSPAGRTPDARRDTTQRVP